MHGNVYEWCWDRYDEKYYKESPANDPRGPVLAYSWVFRGGGWYRNPHGARSACRGRSDAESRYNYLGFRVARVQSSEGKAPRIPDEDPLMRRSPGSTSAETLANVIEYTSPFFISDTHINSFHRGRTGSFAIVTRFPGLTVKGDKESLPVLAFRSVP